MINIVPCVVDHGLHLWPSRAPDKAEGCVRGAEIRDESPIVVRGSQNDEDRNEDDDAAAYGYDPTVLQESQIRWLGDAVALMRDQETQR